MEKNDVLGDGEAEARAGDGLRTAFVDAIEAAEDPVALRGGDAFAVIGDADGRAVAALADRDVDGAVLAAVLDGVVDEVRQRLLDAHRIDVHARAVAGDDEAEM